MTSLFDYADTYPHQAGHKEPTTSRAAAKSIDAGRLQRKVLEALAIAPGTADQLAKRVGEDKLSIRPRLSELQLLGKVRDSGRRGQNASGKAAKIFELTGEAN